MNSALESLLAGKAAAVAAPAPAAATPAPAPGPAVLADAGSPQKNLVNLVEAFKARGGLAPKVNPPESVKVLETLTHAEAGGAPQPDEKDDGPAVEPPTTKPQSVLEAEAAKNTRRTAAVVQKELDAALEELAAVKAKLDAQSGEMAGYAVKVRNEFEAETALLSGDLAKAHARLAEQDAQLQQAVEIIQSFELSQSAAPVAAVADGVNWDTVTEAQLAKTLSQRGFKVTLEVLPA
jgi:hypothetical protein